MTLPLRFINQIYRSTIEEHIAEKERLKGDLSRSAEEQTLLIRESEERSSEQDKTHQNLLKLVCTLIYIVIIRISNSLIQLSGDYIILKLNSNDWFVKIEMLNESTKVEYKRFRKKWKSNVKSGINRLLNKSKRWRIQLANRDTKSKISKTN